MKTILKKAVVIILALMLAACTFGCGSDGTVPASDGDGLKIVTTIFPEYDWVMNILGETSSDAEVIMLLNNGVDMHSFQPTAEDILNISTADLFIYVGGESDSWAEDILATAGNDNMMIVNLLDVLGDAAKEEEVVEGMQAEEDHEHEGEGSEEEPEYDEHIWLSLRNAQTLVGSIEEALEQADPENAETYKANASAYIEKLASLEKEYEAAVAEAPVKTLLFGDRFPFRYMTDDLGLTYFAAFVGCSAETEASFETITFLAGKVDELGLKSVMTIDGSDKKIAETIVKTSASKDQEILTLNSMQSVTQDDIANGVDYLSIMNENLAVLKEALK